MKFKPKDIQIDGLATKEVVFLSTSTPHISWKNPEDFVQAAWQITAKNANGDLVWDSGIVRDSECRWRKWGGPPVQVRQNVEVSVRVFAQDGQASDYSEPVVCERTLADNMAWEDAKWLWFDRTVYTTTPPSPFFRRTFKISKKVIRARLYITARGVFRAHLNGQIISHDLLQPGWVDFKQHIPFVTYDITPQMRQGENVIGAVLADGWCCGNLTIFRKRNVYHSHPELLARIEMTYADGSRESIVSDESWRMSTGPILASDLYDGETYDARFEMPGWDTSAFDDSTWFPAAVAGPVEAFPLLISKQTPPVRYGNEIKPIACLTPRKDVFIWDFGQNFTGVFRVRFRSQTGRLLRFRVAEMLDEYHMLYTENYRSAKSEDCYICAGDGKDVVEYIPAFTFHGFRYLQISGFQLDSHSVEEIEVTGLPMYSDMPQLATFTTGLPDLNRLWLNAVWGQRSNFLELPTDCPQRDERMGWTGDAQVFSQTAMLNMDCLAFFRKYLRDVREAMSPEGAAPSIAPAILRIQDGAAGWGDAIVTIPWNLYCHYGNADVLEENYEAMKRANAWQLNHSSNGIPTAEQFGDWLALEDTPKSLVATAYFAYTTHLIAKIAHVLGKQDDEKYYFAQAEDIRCAFRRDYLDMNGLVCPATQCALAMALEFDLLLPEQQQANRQALNQAVLQNGLRIQTGFLGTPLLLPGLLHAGYPRTACDLLLQEKYPSWLYSVRQGATTFWEHWNSFSEENGFQDSSMNSFNHYAYGTVAKFMLEEIGGIHYHHGNVVFKIIPDKRFSPVHASFDSPYGVIASDWRLDDNGHLFWNVKAPLCLNAKAELPNGSTVILDRCQRVFDFYVKGN